MLTIVCDAIEHRGPPLISKKSYPELLEETFPPETEFYVNGGVLYFVFADCDYAEN